jgi:hypothetical protein
MKEKKLKKEKKNLNKFPEWKELKSRTMRDLLK